MAVTNTTGTQLDAGRSTRFDAVREKDGEGVGTTSLSYDRQDARWDLVDDLRGGSDSMRDANVKWTPMERGETDDSYQARLRRSFLLGAYDDTIDKLTSKPFSRDVELKGDENLPEQLRGIEDDVDLEGTNLTSFGAQVFDEALHRGVCYVLVDFAPVDAENAPSALEERDAGLRPYFVRVTAKDLIGYTSERAASGEQVLTSIRIKTTVVRPTEKFGEVELDAIKLITAPRLGEDGTLEPGTWSVFVKDPESEEFVVEAGFPRAHTFPGIPLVPIYFRKFGPFEGRPALWKLAELNLKHWQSQSDQDNLLHYARVPILFRRGFSKDEIDKPLEIGSGRAVSATSKDAQMSYVEAQGHALGAGRSDLDATVERMEVAGLDPLLRRASASLATGLAIGAQKEQNLLQAWASITSMGLRRSYEFAGIFVREPIPEEFEVDIFDEFGLKMGSDSSFDDLLEMWKDDGLSDETLLKEAKRHARLSDSVDVLEELERIEAQRATRAGRALALQQASGLPPGGGQADEDEEEEGAAVGGAGGADAGGV